MASTSFVYNSHEVRYIEQDYAEKHNGSCYDLMMRAGHGVFNQLIKRRPHPKMVWIFVGTGNNGGDGYVVGSCLLSAGIAHRIFATGLPREGADAQKARAMYLSLGGSVECGLPCEHEIAADEPDVVVDALLGTGMTSAPRPPVDSWILFINKLNAFKVAIDVPSGLNADTGTAAGDCVYANLTVATIAFKPGLLTADAVDYVGEAVAETLGVSLQEYFGQMQDNVEHSSPKPIIMRTFEDVIDELPYRLRSANKGDAGKILIIGGAKGFGGAAIMAAMGAMRTGAGLVKVALDPSNVPALNSLMPEVMSVDFYDDEAVEQALEWADAVAVGPGLGRSQHARDLVAKVQSSQAYQIFDADALNILAEEGGYNTLRIITPHPGEAARLLKTTVEEVNADRIKACVALQERYGGTVLLKGAGSIICDSALIYIIKEGSPAMATGGMGDILTGVTAALIKMTSTFSAAMVTAACLHGRAGYLAGQDGVIGAAATDLLPHIRTLVNTNQNRFLC